MKKLFCIILSALMVLGCMTGCAKSNKNLSKAYNKQLAKLEYDDTDLPVLKVATSPDFAPMEFIDLSRSGDDQFVGFDILLATYLAKNLGYKLQICPMSFDAAMTAVQTGNADMAISGFSWTAERAKNFLITNWYIAGANENEQVVITTKENAGKYTKAEDYIGKKVAAQGGSLQEILVNEQLPGCEIVLFENLNDAVMALMTGKVEAVAVAKGNGDAFISANEGKIDFSGFNFFVQDLYKNNVILINKNNTELLNKVNPLLDAALEQGLYNPWYEACQMLANIKDADELGYDDEGNKITE